MRSDFSWNRKQNDDSTSTRIEYIGENRHGLNFSQSMYVFMVITFSRVWTSRVRSPTFLVFG